MLCRKPQAPSSTLAALRTPQAWGPRLSTERIYLDLSSNLYNYVSCCLRLFIAFHPVHLLCICIYMLYDVQYVHLDEWYTCISLSLNIQHVHVTE